MAQPSFPQNVKEWTDKQDHVDDVFASDINNAYAEIIAMQKHMKPVADTGTANAYVATVENVTEYFDGLTVIVKIANSNTGVSTFKANSLAAVPIKKEKDLDLVADDLKSGQYVTFVYDGTDFQIASALNGMTQLQNEVLNNLNTQTLSLSTADSIKSVTANVGSVPKVRIESNIANNILGNKGNCESLSDWKLGGISPTLDTSKKMFGNASFRYVKNSQNGYIYEDFANIGLNKYYVLSWWINIEVALSGRNNVYLSDYNTHNNEVEVASASALTNGKPLNTWIRIGAKFKSTKEKARLAMFGGGDTGIGTYNFDGIMLQEITTDDYNNLTVDQLLAKYPYVNGVQPLLNPCLTIRGKNLFEFSSKTFDFKTGTTDLIKYLENGMEQTTSSLNSWRAVKHRLKVEKNKTLYYKSNMIFDVNYANINIKDINNNIIHDIGSTEGNKIGSFSTGNNQYIDIETRIYSDNIAKKLLITDFIISSINVPYEPYREKQRIYPCTLAKVGDYADELEDDGVKTVKTWRVKKYVLQASDITTLNTAAFTNLDVLSVNRNALAGMYARTSVQQNKLIIPKFKQGTGLYITNNTTCIGEWYDNNQQGPSISLGIAKGTYANLAAAQAALTGTEIWYVLAQEEQEIIEPIGSLRLEQGYNCIDISTGIVYERANFKLSSGYYYLNFPGVSGSLLSKKVKTIVGIYKDGISTNNWERMLSSGWTVYGNEGARIPEAQFDPMADYRAKYEALHEDYNSQQVQVTLEYADNLRTSHNQLVENVAGLESEVNDVWFSLLILADKEIGMKMISLLTTETTADLKNKINEILNVWR